MKFFMTYDKQRLLRKDTKSMKYKRKIALHRNLKIPFFKCYFKKNGKKSQQIGRKYMQNVY
jgi:hypothetical protein